MRSAAAPLVLGLSLALPTPAQAVNHDAQIWTTVGASAKLSDKWRLSEEITARFSDSRNGLYQLQSSTLLGYRLTDKITIWAGYVHDPHYEDGHLTYLERRAREQVTFDKLAKIAAGTVDGRFRLEQRWREGIDGNGWRARPFVRIVWPLTRGGKTALLVSHESFFNLNETSYQTRGYDRMRNMVGVSTPLTKDVSAVVGYLNQYTFVRGGEDTMDNIAAVTLSLRLTP